MDHPGKVIAVLTVTNILNEDFFWSSYYVFGDSLCVIVALHDNLPLAND